MDKKLLNNEIVSMRPEANRAKVHTISKLNREVKRLRVQKSYQPEAVKQKNHHKAERLVEELLLIKKLRHDEITKFALRHSKSAASAILSNPSSSPESRCLSRLALHMGLATRVEMFRTKFPNWETTLVTLMASIGVKVKRSKVIAKSLGLLKPRVNLDGDVEETSDGINNEEESNTEQVDGDTSNDSDEEEDSDSETNNNSVFNEVKLVQQVESDGSVEKLLRDYPNTRLKHIEKGKRVISNAKRLLKSANEEVDLSTSKKKAFPKKVAYDHASIEVREEDEPKSCVNLKKDRSSALRIKKQKTSKNVKEVNAGKDVGQSSKSTANKQVKTKVVAKRSKEMKVMRFTELLGLNTSTETPIENNNEPSSKLATKTVDTFFVTEDGQSEFLSTVPIKDPIIEQKAVNYAPQEVYDSSGRRLNRREIRSRLHGKSSFKGYSSRPPLNKNYSNKWAPADIPATSKWKDTAAQLQPKIFLPPVVNETLHPSWEAKKKQKEQLSTVFQGKKIKFDD